MKLKLDEKTRAQELLRAQGHQVETVRQEGMGGAADPELYRACCNEGRCLLTLDRDFTDVTHFPPGPCGGIVVIRLPTNPSLALLESLVDQFHRRLSLAPVEGQLWIVEPGRIRIHQAETDPQ